MAKDIRYIHYMDVDGIKDLSPEIRLSSTLGEWAISARTDENGGGDYPVQERYSAENFGFI
jgi:hypothetical protein